MSVIDDNTKNGDLNHRIEGSVKRNAPALRRRVILPQGDKAEGSISSQAAQRRPLFVRVPGPRSSFSESSGGRSLEDGFRETHRRVAADDPLNRSFGAMDVRRRVKDSLTGIEKLLETERAPPIKTDSWQPEDLSAAGFDRINSITERIAGFDEEMRRLRERLSMPSQPVMPAPVEARAQPARFREEIDPRLDLMDSDMEGLSEEARQAIRDDNIKRKIPAWAHEKVRVWKNAGKPRLVE